MTTPRHHRTIAGVLVASVSLLVACSGSGNTSDTTADSTPPTEVVTTDSASPDTTTGGEATPLSGGTLRIGVEADVAGLNPAGNVMPAVGMWMGEAVFDTLAKVGADGSAVPYLAESITPDDTLTNWTMKLRSGVTFHDGTPVDAESVIATFEGQLADPVIGLTVVPLFAADNLIEKVDDLTVVYH
ncbi:MAG: hypothetical protein RI900_3279, partial [Actinomycetota bacterium]